MTHPPFRKAALPALLLSASCLAGCAEKPPKIAYDDTPRPAALTPDPPRLVRIIEMPTPLPLPGQLMPMPGDTPLVELRNPIARVAAADAAARLQPTRDGFLDAMQIYPFSDGALYQIYTAPDEVTDIALEAGEKLVGSGPIAAGDTVRWIIGDTVSGTGEGTRVHILVKPTRSDLRTNLVIDTDRRTYHLELRSTAATYMASVSWQYAEDQLIALRQQNVQADAVQPLASGIDVAALNFRYRIEGDAPAWKPLRAFDDGRQVFIEFPSGIAEGEMPPLFVVGSSGKDSELVNYRVHGAVMIVDRLFAAAELMMGDKASQQRVRVVRTDGQPG